MRKILEFLEFADRESPTRTKSIDEEEFLRVFRENCKNFSFDNSLLWRQAANFGPFGLFFSADRRGTIGSYRYKDFFDDRKGYPVPRQPGLRVHARPGADGEVLDEEFSDEHFLLRQYDPGFQAPEEELFSTMAKTKLSSLRDTVVKKRLGFEFFTDANCLMIEMEKVEWLRSNI